MEVEEILEEIGLSEQNAKVYLSLLKLGTSLASQVAEETKINRSVVYQILDRLIKLGFVSYVIKENKRYYAATHPERLIGILKEREERLKSALPQLANLAKPREEKPAVEIFEGKEGMKTILLDILRVSKNWYAFGSPGLGHKIMPYFVEPWEIKRQKQKIKLLVICNDSPEGRKRGEEFSKMKFTEVKYMPEKYSSPAVTYIYGDRLVIMMWSYEYPFAIRMISKKLVESYMNHFNVLWKLSRRR